MPDRRKVFAKKNIAFFGITGLLLVTTFIKLPCPACDGAGKVSTSVNMDHVFFSSLNTTLKLLNADFCMGYTLYQYAIEITLTNDADAEASGWITLNLRSASMGKILDTQYMGVKVPAKSTVVDSFTIYFKTSYDTTQDVYIDPGVDQGSVKCLVCSGSGHLPMNLWLVASNIKSSLAKIVAVERTYQPPPPPIFPPGE
jgi:hypothetical protein